MGDSRGRWLRGDLLIGVLVLAQELDHIVVTRGHSVVELHRVTGDDLGGIVQALLRPCALAVLSVAVEEAEDVSARRVAIRSTAAALEMERN